MSFKINTNKYGVYAQARTKANNEQLTSSLEKLSSGVKINKAADDASGLAIANTLKMQSNGLGQSIKNANDAISIIQIADNALGEVTNMLQTIRTKAVQSAQDGQSYESRLAIQKDVQKLMEQINNISKTTSFNGSTLLDGSFSSKEFQIGAYSNQTLNMTVNATDTKSIGHLRTEQFNIQNLNGNNDIDLNSQYALKLNGVELESVTMGHNRGEGVGELAKIINSRTNETKTSADYSVEMISPKPIKAGSVSDLIINGVSLGSIDDILAGDSDNKLVSVINSVKDSTGVNASITSSGNLHLSSSDGRAIKIENAGSIMSTKVTGQADFAAPAAGDDIVINGVNVGLAGGEDIATTVADINAQATVTGVTARALTVDPSVVPNRIEYEGYLTSLTTVNASGTFVTGVADRTDENIEYGNLTLSSIGDEDIRTEFSQTSVQGANSSYVAPAGAGSFDLNGTTINYAGGETATNMSDLINAEYQNTGIMSSVDNITGDLKLEGNVKSLVGLFPINGIKDVHLDTEAPDKLSFKTLDDIDTNDLLTTLDGAMTAIDILDAALKNVDTIRGDLGSTQNQLTATVNTITITEANTKIAESQIRDLDFAEETNNFNKFKLLSQAGTFALSQANTVQQNVLKLLQ